MEPRLQLTDSHLDSGYQVSESGDVGFKKRKPSFQLWHYILLQCGYFFNPSNYLLSVCCVLGPAREMIVKVGDMVFPLHDQYCKKPSARYRKTGRRAGISGRGDLESAWAKSWNASGLIQWAEKGAESGDCSSCPSASGITESWKVLVWRCWWG